MRYLVDRRRPVDDAYEGPAIKVIGGKRTVVVSELDPASADIVRSLIGAKKSGNDSESRSRQ
jgi:hypothetical protein